MAHQLGLVEHATGLGRQTSGKSGFKRAAVAVARKLAVMMHAMLKTGELFDRSAGIVAAA